MFRLFHDNNIDFLGHKAVFITVSVVLMVIGCIGVVARGFNLGVDFSGGSLYHVQFTKAPSPDEIRATVRKATISLDITPVFCGSSFKNKGVQRLLDGVIDYLPSPLDIPPAVGHAPRQDAEIVREPDPKAPFAALAFKIATDPFVGRITFARVYSGTLEKGDAMINASNEKKERAGREGDTTPNRRQSQPPLRQGAGGERLHMRQAAVEGREAAIATLEREEEIGATQEHRLRPSGS